MPFNSSTPKIDGYYISSILATETKKKAADEGSFLACKSTLTTYRWAEVSAQPDSRKYCTYILFTVTKRKGRTENKKQTHRSPGKAHRHYTFGPTLFTLFTHGTDSNARKKSLCFPFLLHRCLTRNMKRMSTFIDRKQASFTVSPPRWQPVANDNRKTVTIWMGGKIG